MNGLISFVSTFLIPAVLTLQALQFYIRSSGNALSNKSHHIKEEDAQQFDSIVILLLVPWLRYWLCYAVLHFVISLPILRNVVEIIPFSGLILILIQLWLYLPRFQGSKIIIDGVLLSTTFKVKLSKDEKGKDNNNNNNSVSLLEYIDYVSLKCTKSVDSTIKSIPQYPLLANNFVYLSCAKAVDRVLTNIENGFDGSVLSYVIFKFSDTAGDPNEMKSKFDQSFGSVRRFVQLALKVDSDAESENYVAPKHPRSASMPSLNVSDHNSNTNNINNNNNNNKRKPVKNYLARMVSESSLFNSKQSPRQRKTYGNL